MEGLEIPLRGEISTPGGVHRRRSSWYGAAVGAAGSPVRGDKIPQPDDITQAQAAASTKDLQAAGQELPEGQSDEHKRRDLGQTAQTIGTFATQFQKLGESAIR